MKQVFKVMKLFSESVYTIYSSETHIKGTCSGPFLVSTEFSVVIDFLIFNEP